MTTGDSTSFGRKASRPTKDRSGAIGQIAGNDRRVRLSSEALVGISLVILAATLLLAGHLAATAIDSNLVIHIPHHERGVPVIPGQFVWTIEPVLHLPAGYGAFGLGVLIVSIGALMRRRNLLATIIATLAFLPWAWFNIHFPFLSASGFLIIAVMAIRAARASDQTRLALLIALPVMAMVLESVGTPGPDAAPVKRAYATSRMVTESRPGELESRIAGANRATVNERLYLEAQLALVRQDFPRVSARLGAIAPDAFTPGSAEDRRIAMMRQALAKAGHAQGEAIDATLFRRSLLEAIVFALAGIAVVGLIAGEGLEWLARLISGRRKRIEQLYRRAESEAPSHTTAWNPEQGVLATLRRMQFRLQSAAVMALIAAGAACLTGGLFLWHIFHQARPAFAAIHVRDEFLATFDGSGEAIRAQAQNVPTTGFSNLVLAMAIVGIVTLLVAAYRRQMLVIGHLLAGYGLMALSILVFLPVAPVVALISLRSTVAIRKRFGIMLLAASIVILPVAHVSLLHRGAVEVDVSAVRPILAAALAHADRLSESGDNGIAALTRYVAAQIAYVDGDVAAAKTHVEWTYSHPLPSSDLARERLAAIRQWLIDQDVVLAEPGYRDSHLMLAGLEAAVWPWLGVISAVLAALAAGASGHFAVLALRTRRMRRLVSEILDLTSANRFRTGPGKSGSRTG